MAEKNAAIDVLKGLLMLAVMLGHNSFLMSATGLFSVLYTFHIPGFFFVAAVLNRNTLTTTKAIDKGITYLYPQIIFFPAISLVFLLTDIGSIKPSLPGWLYALISGNGFMAKEYSGFQLLWYLPAIYSFYLLVGFYNGLSNWLAKIALLTIPFIAVLLLYANGLTLKYFPFGLAAVAFIFPIAIVVRWLYDRYGQSIWLYIIALFVVGALFGDAKHFLFNLATTLFYRQAQPTDLMYELLFMTAMFLVLLKASTWLSGNKFLAFIGRHTLEIFLTHHLFDVLIIKWLAMHRWLPTTPEAELAMGSAMFLTVLTLSLAIATIADRSKLRLLFHPPQMLSRPVSVNNS